MMRNYPSVDVSVTDQRPALADIYNKTGLSNSKTESSL